MEDLYKILGVNRNATPEDIKKAYHKLAKHYHPDFNPNDSESEYILKKINNAYSILSDAKQRSEYDRQMFHYLAEEHDNNDYKKPEQTETANQQTEPHRNFWKSTEEVLWIIRDIEKHFPPEEAEKKINEFKNYYYYSKANQTGKTSQQAEQFGPTAVHRYRRRKTRITILSLTLLFGCIAIYMVMLQKYAGRNLKITCFTSAAAGFTICLSLSYLFDGFYRIHRIFTTLITCIVISIIFLGVGWLLFFLSPVFRMLVVIVLIICSTAFIIFHFSIRF